MKFPKGSKCHICAPSDFKRTPNLTGCYELDAMIRHTSNHDMIDRLSDHISSSGGYGSRTGYNGYNGYSGDD